MINRKEKSRLLILVADKLRPHIIGNITVKGEVEPGKIIGGGLSLNGLLIEGKLSVLKHSLGDLSIAHCTLLSGKGGLEIGDEEQPVSKDVEQPAYTGSNQPLKIKIFRSVLGPINLNKASIDSMKIEDYIIDNNGNLGIDAMNTPVSINSSTVLGNTYVKTLNAGNSIFMGEVKVERRQTGCMRFSYVPRFNQKTPKRFRCQPELEITGQCAELAKAGKLSDEMKSKITSEVSQWLTPGLTSLDGDHYRYGQLNKNCPLQISGGAEDGSEMGAFSFLKQPQRAANLRIALDEYLPLGLESGIFLLRDYS